MGLEIRLVPAGWEHPRVRCEHSPWAGGCEEAKRHGGQCYQPLHDRDFETEAREWLDAAIAWDNGTEPDAAEFKWSHPFYWQWAGDPPDAKYYRPKWTDEERTHFQVYEAVSEGTPVTPAFATREELVEHLVAHGTDWDKGGWQREHAEKFVGRGWAPSMVVENVGGVVTIKTPRDGA